MNSTADKILCQITAATAACHWLPTGAPMGETKLTDLLSFAWQLPSDGLPWQCRSRDDRTALEDLRRRGLVTVAGATSGIRVSLTLAGAACFWRLDVAAETAASIAAMPSCRTPWGADVILGCELCPSAGDWWTTAGASAAGWDHYLTELAAVQTALKPLFVMGWMRQFVSVSQRVWAVQLTDTGRDAATNPPQIEPDAGFAFDADVYTQAWREAVRKYSDPPDCEGALARFLPASRWMANQFDASL
jgi:hypothetical protein